jgi:hypothetical protein
VCESHLSLVDSVPMSSFILVRHGSPD